MTFQVDWDERRQLWVAWCHQHGKPEARADDPVEALHLLLERLNKEIE